MTKTINSISLAILLSPLLIIAEVPVEIVRSVRVSFPTEIDTQYQVYTSTNVDSEEWEPLGSPIEGTGEIHSIHQDSDDPDNTFFKVEELGGETVPDVEEFTVVGMEMVMVAVPSGTFLMGSPDDEIQRGSEEGPQTNVSITESFWMSKYEVTIAQVRQYLLSGGSKSDIDFADEECPINDDELFSLRGNRHGLSNQQPMVEFSWIGAASFCEWLTERERAGGRLPEGFEYRLPTEAQWEYACRAGTTTIYSFGNDENFNLLGNYAWFSSNSDNRTHPVGGKLPNPWGLYDMHGNVYEWCSDWYGDYKGGFQVDPKGPTLPQVSYKEERIRRGGTYFHPLDAARSANRSGEEESDTGKDQGFRPALVSVP